MQARRSIARQVYDYAVRLVQEEVQVPMPTGMTTVTCDLYIREDAQPAVVPPSIRDQILAHVTDNPGNAQPAVLRAVGGDDGALRKELKSLVDEGVVREEKHGKALIYVPAAPTN